MRGYLTIALSLAIAVRWQDIASQHEAWEKTVEARHDALLKQWGIGNDAALREELHARYVRDQDARRSVMTLPQAQWTDSMDKHRQQTMKSLSQALSSCEQRSRSAAASRQPLSRGPIAGEPGDESPV
ncbi:MAG: hypothetical protein JSS95_14950 [Acidobacteria bacterium]|nr:hypothetical protein [Acidobacteriota bacterium]